MSGYLHAFVVIAAYAATFVGGCAAFGIGAGNAIDGNAVQRRHAKWWLVAALLLLCNGFAMSVAGVSV